ncbi:hypothetical protein NXW76_00655 [Bacteroides thetaiotaomicron]|nr:hypothetical protein [Bacteroides thetaiotaomicron]
MKKIYLPILLLTLAVSSCDTFDKVPSSEWPSEGAIKTLEDLQFAVNGVYESQTSSIDAGTNPRGATQVISSCTPTKEAATSKPSVAISKQLMYMPTRLLRIVLIHTISTNAFIFLWQE